jgi:mono/diheme cytochrome c family protein
MLLALTLALAGRPPHIERVPDAPVPMPVESRPELQKGARLFRTANCVGCHSPPFTDAEHLGGGRDLPTLFGVFYAPNISPDPLHGIGTWSEDDFVRAMRKGRAPDGHRYWPTFPYMTYTRMTDADLHALWLYLRAQDPVSTPEKRHEVYAPYRYPGLLGLWRRLAFQRGPVEDDPTASAEWNRGRYLVRAVAYCDQCHTPRNRLGLRQKRRDMAGGANPGKADVHPNLTPHPTVGIGQWTVDDVAHYLGTAEKPDGTQTLLPDIMAEKIHDSFAFLPLDDRRAIGTYLLDLPPKDFDPSEWRQVRRARRKLHR